jgi:hypothetical protein
MKDIKSYLINEAKSYNLNNIKYTMVSYYLREEPRAYLIEDISEISDIYYDWDLTPEKVDEIIKKVENLKVNECFVNKAEENDFEIISRIK